MKSYEIAILRAVVCILLPTAASTFALLGRLNKHETKPFGLLARLVFYRSRNESLTELLIDTSLNSDFISAVATRKLHGAGSEIRSQKLSSRFAIDAKDLHY